MARGAFRLSISFPVALFLSGCVIPPKHFSIHQVTAGIFIGTEPTSQRDFAILKSNGVRTVVSLQCLPWNIRRDAEFARANSMRFQHIPLPAWPFQPSERRVKQAVLVLADKSLQPIFAHCYLGHDRAALVVGLYRIYYENWTPDDAWAEALQNGFKIRWALSGLRNYFWRHCQKPDWARSPALPCTSVTRTSPEFLKHEAH
jgi:Tyrosine phosphatase family